MGQGTLGEVQDGSGDPRRDTERVERLSGRSETCFGTLEEVWDGLGTLGDVRDGSGDPLRSLGWVEGPFARSGKGRGTLGEVRGCSGDPRGGLGQVG